MACLLLLAAFDAPCQTHLRLPKDARPLIQTCQEDDKSNNLPIGDSSKANKRESTDFERSSKSAVARLCRSALKGEEKSLQIELAANAIDLSLEAGQIEVAISIISMYAKEIAFDPSDKIPSHLHFEVAQARALSYRDKNREALELRQRLQPSLDLVFGEYSYEAIENRLRTANLQIEFGRLSNGLSELIRLTTITQNVLPHESSLWRLARESEALALAVDGNEREAIRKLRDLRADVALIFGASDGRVIDIDEDIASVLLRREELEEAQRIESNVFLWRVKHLPPESHKLIQTLWRLGYLLVMSRRTETARAVLSHVAQELITKDFSGSNRLLLQTMSRIASIDVLEGHFETALDTWRRVYEGERELVGDTATDTQIEATNYAISLMRTGNVDSACNLLEDSLKNQERSHPDDIWSKDFTRIAYNHCLLETKNPDSIVEARESLHVTWAEIAQHLGQTSTHAILALSTYAKATMLSGRREEAKELLIQLVRTKENFRQVSTSGGSDRGSSISAWTEDRTTIGDEIPGYRELALLHAQDAELERALRISELVRDRTLQDRFAEQTWRHTQLPAKARDHVDKLIDRIQDLEEHIAVEPDIVERIRLESERTLLIAERRRLERQLRDRLHTAPSSPHPPTLDELRTRLAPDTALVSVLHSGDTWWALVILRNEPARFIDLQDPDLGLNASAWVQRLRGEAVRAWPLPGNRVKLDAVRPENAVGPYFTLDQLAKRLSDRLLLPLKEAVGNARHLVFVSDDELVGAPLQALPLGSGLALDRFEISYAPSLATYFRWQVPARSDAHALELLAIGAVDYHSIAPLATDDAIAIGVQVAENHPLPFARAEIDAIAALFPAARTTTWAGSQANKEALRHVSRTGALRRYRYVHIAAHAWAQADQPESSAIVLAGADEDLPTHRALTAAELAGLQMGSELIVLSACDTAAGHFEHGQGLLGLAYAGLAAGNRAALLSLWPVADDTTARFMVGLYAKLRHGETPALALAATQREFRHSGDPRLSDPLVWAPFILYGGY